MLAAAARAPRAQLARFFSAVPTVKNVINGEFVESKTTKWVDIHNPGNPDPPPPFPFPISMNPNHSKEATKS